MDKVGVIHGRFQVLHNDHLRYLLAGKEQCEFLVVGITNPDPASTASETSDTHRSSSQANPLTYFERHMMMREALVEAGLTHDQFTVVPFPVNYPDRYSHYLPMDAVFYLTIYDDWGRTKLTRFQELGLETRVLWERDQAHKGITGSQVRQRILNGKEIDDLVPSATARLVEEWDLGKRLDNLK